MGGRLRSHASGEILSSSSCCESRNFLLHPPSVGWLARAQLFFKTKDVAHVARGLSSRSYHSDSAQGALTRVVGIAGKLEKGSKAI